MCWRICVLFNDGQSVLMSRTFHTMQGAAHDIADGLWRDSLIEEIGTYFTDSEIDEITIVKGER